jgi:hypothetical protein
MTLIVYWAACSTPDAGYALLVWQTQLNPKEIHTAQGLGRSLAIRYQQTGIHDDSLD